MAENKNKVAPSTQSAPQTQKQQASPQAKGPSQGKRATQVATVRVLGFFDQLDRLLDKTPPEDDIQKKLDAEPFLVSYKQKIVFSFAAVTCALISLSVFYVAAKAIKPPPIVLVDPQGEDIFKPMSLPNQSQTTVQQWALEVIQKLYTFNFLHMDDQLGDAEKYFTKQAWNLFIDSYPDADIYKTAKNNKLSVSVVPIADPIIESTMSVKGTGEDFAWVVLVPVLVSFTGDTPTQSIKKMIRVTIIRVPTTDNEQGLGVQQLAG